MNILSQSRKKEEECVKERGKKKKRIGREKKEYRIQRGVHLRSSKGQDRRGESKKLGDNGEKNYLCENSTNVSREKGNLKNKRSKGNLRGRTGQISVIQGNLEGDGKVAYKKTVRKKECEGWATNIRTHSL